MPANPQIITLPVATRLLRPEIVYFEQIDSTNNYLLSNHAHPTGTIVMADYQTAGRGRRGRSWEAPKGEALLFSCYLAVNPVETPLFIYTFIAAVSVREALQKNIPNASFYLKWPNDILLEHHKVCGILVQSKIVSAQKAIVVIGIGVNVNQSAEFFQRWQTAGSLFSLTGKRFDRTDLLSDIVVSLDNWLQPEFTRQPEVVLRQWKLHCPFIGRMIQVDDGKHIFSGYFQDVASDGGLVLRSDSQVHLFHAADVTIVKEY